MTAKLKSQRDENSLKRTKLPAKIQFHAPLTQSLKGVMQGTKINKLVYKRYLEEKFQ